MELLQHIAESRTRLNDFTFTFHFHALEKETAAHSSVLAWRISGTGEPGGLPSMGSHGVGHDWSDLAAAASWFQGPEYLWILVPRSPHLGPSLLYCWFEPSLPLGREQLAAQLWTHSSSASPRVGFHWTNLGHALIQNQLWQPGRMKSADWPGLDHSQPWRWKAGSNPSAWTTWTGTRRWWWLSKKKWSLLPEKWDWMLSKQELRHHPFMSASQMNAFVG